MKSFFLVLNIFSSTTKNVHIDMINVIRASVRTIEETRIYNLAYGIYFGWLITSEEVINVKVSHIIG